MEKITKRTEALEAIKYQVSNFNMISDELANDRSFLLEAIESNYLVFNAISEKFKEDQAFLGEAVKRNGQILEFLPQYQSDKGLILEAVRKDPYILRNNSAVSAELLNDKNFLLECVMANWGAIVFVPSSLVKENEVNEILAVYSGSSKLEQAIKKVSLLNEYIYQATVGLAEDLLTEKFNKICEEKGLGKNDKIPEELRNIIFDKLYKTKTMINIVKLFHYLS